MGTYTLDTLSPRSPMSFIIEPTRSLSDLDPIVVLWRRNSSLFHRACPAACKVVRHGENARSAARRDRQRFDYHPAERTGPGSDVLLWMPLGLQGISDRRGM